MKQLFYYKHGDVEQGRWVWAIGANPRVPEMQRPLCLATMNFHGCVASSQDPEQLVKVFAKAPEVLRAAKAVVELWDAHYKLVCEETPEDDADEIALFEWLRELTS